MRFPDGGIGVERVVGEKGVDPVEVPFGGMDGFRATDLFGRLAKELEGSPDAVLLHGSFGSEDPAEGTDPKHGMRIGVAGGPGMEPIARRLEGHGLLRVAGNRIVFGIGADDGSRTIPPGGREGGRHTARALLHVPTIGAQQIDIGLG